MMNYENREQKTEKRSLFKHKYMNYRKRFQVGYRRRVRVVRVSEGVQLGVEISTAHHTTPHHTTPHHTIGQHSTAQHSTPQHSTAQHTTAQHSTA
jgi:flagellar biogenesis protein FliO